MTHTDSVSIHKSPVVVAVASEIRSRGHEIATMLWIRLGVLVAVVVAIAAALSMAAVIPS